MRIIPKHYLVGGCEITNMYVVIMESEVGRSSVHTTDTSNPNRVPVVWETFKTFDDAFPVT